ARIAEERPSAVLLDLLMPEPDGFAVLYRLRQNPALHDLPVIVMTAKELSETDYERINGSAQRVLSKGTDLTRLVRDLVSSILPEAQRA
ncbi:MAG TPA: response regulator, partial [Thermoanaerobaculia bacterium]